MTDDITDVGSYLDGRQGYRMTGTNGLMTLTLDAIDPSGLTAVVSILFAIRSYSSLDNFDISFVGRHINS